MPETASLSQCMCIECMWWVYYTCARLIPGLVFEESSPTSSISFPTKCINPGPALPFRKTTKFANADWDLTNIFANCKFDTPSSFKDILNNHTFSVRKKCPGRNASPGASQVMVRTLWFGNISLSWIIEQRIMFSDRAWPSFSLCTASFPCRTEQYNDLSLIQANTFFKTVLKYLAQFITELQGAR
jgi:hypothetical protein